MEKKKSGSKVIVYETFQVIVITLLMLLLMYFRLDIIDVIVDIPSQGYWVKLMISWIRQIVTFQYLFIIPVGIYYVRKIQSQTVTDDRVKFLSQYNRLLTIFWLLNLVVSIVASFGTHYWENSLVYAAVSHLITWNKGSYFFMSVAGCWMIFYLIVLDRNLNKSNLRKVDDATVRLQEGAEGSKQVPDNVERLNRTLRK